MLLLSRRIKKLIKGEGGGGREGGESWEVLIRVVGSKIFSENSNRWGGGEGFIRDLRVKLEP